MAVTHTHTQARSAAAAANAASAAASAAAGYDSDQEVYAAAKAADRTDGQQYDSDDNLIVSCALSMQCLPANPVWCPVLTGCACCVFKA